jgi:hypothetical protein
MFTRKKGGEELKRIVAVLIICILCIPMFSVMILRASAQTGSGSVEAGVYTNPVPSGYGFVNFEDGTDGQVIRSTLPGLNFTTTLGYDWVYSDVRTGKYNGRSLTDPSVNYGQYVVNGYICAWLGPTMGEGRIDFVNGPASYLSVLTSTYSGLSIDAYDANKNLIATSGWANGNLGTYTFTRLTVEAPNMAYVIIHDAGNYWIIDDLVSDAGGNRGFGPGAVFTCVHVSADPFIILETPGQSSNIVATVSDQLGNPMSGVIVYFTSSEGTLSSASAQTDNEGKATVTLSPSSSTTSPVVVTVSAEASGASASTYVIFCPTSAPATGWSTCPQFSIKSNSFYFSQYLRPCVLWYNLFHPFNPISLDSLNSLPPVSIYTIMPSSSADPTSFAQALHQFFDITAPDNYNPVCVYVLDIPLLQTINTLFSTDIQGPVTFPIPPAGGLNVFLSSQHVTTTAAGSLVFAFTFSQVKDKSQGIIDLLQAMAKDLVSSVKNPDPETLIGILSDALNTITETCGDVSVNVITSDMDQSGQLNSYTLLDVVHIASTLSTILTANGIIMKSVDLLWGGTEAAVTGGLDVPADVQTAFHVLDLGLEILPYLPALSSLKDNSLYQILSNGVSMIAGIIDPNGTTAVPSIYDMGGSLVLGYNSTSSDIIYASPEGLLIPADGDWLILLNESQSNPVNYTVILYAVGGNAAVPYDLQILSSNQNVTAIGYAGMVLGGTSTTIPVGFSPDGTLIQQVYLNPTVSVGETGNVYDFVATGLLSNGSLASVSRAFLIINGSQFAMRQDNSSTFEIQTPVNLPGNVSYFVYMISPNVPGGIASGVLTQYNITFDQTNVGSDFTGTIVTIDGSNYDISTLPMSFWWYNGSTHTFAFQSPLVVGSGAKQYDWISTSGLSPSQSGSITVTGLGSVVGDYVIIIDDTPPTTTLTIDEPKYTSDKTYVTPDTHFTLEATDTGSGVHSTAYRIYNATYDSGWQTYTTLFKLTSLKDGTYTLAYNSTDNAGNVEKPITKQITLVRAYDCPRDVTGDGKVDICDITMICVAYDSKPGDPNWNPIVDFCPQDWSHDIINIYDIVTCLQYYGP